MATLNWKTTAGAMGLLALTGAVAWAAGQKPATQPTTKQGSVKLDENRTLGKPTVFKNLTIIPVFDRKAVTTDTYLTLDE